MATEIKTSEQQQGPTEPQALRKTRPSYMEEEFKDFSNRVKTRVNDGPTEQQPHTRLEKYSPELEEWKKTGEVKPKQEKESTEANRDAKPADEQSRDVTENDEPRPDDRIWTKGLEGKDLESHHKRVETQAKASLDHIASHARRQDIQAGLQNIFRGRNAQFNDFMGALSEVKNPGEVLAHIGLNAQDRNILLSLPTWQAVRTAVHQISKGLLPKPTPKPRAPKPPSEVGGRGVSPPDEERAAVRANDFRAASAVWDRRHFGK